MGRRKGVTNKKTKNSGNSNNKKTDAGNAKPISIKELSLIKDDPGGKKSNTVMEVVAHFPRRNTARQQLETDSEGAKIGGNKLKSAAFIQLGQVSPQQPCTNDTATSSASSNSYSTSDHKYLHKKFKRVASATVSDSTESDLGDIKRVVNPENCDNSESVNINNNKALKSAALRFIEERTRDDAKQVQKSNGSDDNEQLRSVRNGYSNCNGYSSEHTLATDHHITFPTNCSVTNLTTGLGANRLKTSNNLIVNSSNNNSSANFISNIDPTKIDNHSYYQLDPVVYHSASYPPPTTLSGGSQDHLGHESAKLLVTSATSSGEGVNTTNNSVFYLKCHSGGGDQSQVNSEGGLSSVGNNSNSSSGGASNAIGRNVCQYCNLNCTKPSVLEKHIRSHTNERPFPCVPCGFAFKTKSNLYKHCRSRAHLLRSQGGDLSGQIPDDDLSLGSDQELSSSASGSDEISRATSPMDDPSNQASPSQQIEKPYKPKFHKASLYAKDDPAKQPVVMTNHHGAPVNQFVFHLSKPFTPAASNVAPKPSSAGVSSHPYPFPQLASHQMEDLEQHISKIISDNEAIIEDVEPPLQKKYHKITGKSRGNSLDLNSGSKSQNSLAVTQLQQFQQMKMLREDPSNSNSLLARHNQLSQITTNASANNSGTMVHSYALQINTPNVIPVNTNSAIVAANSNNSRMMSGNSAAISLRSKPVTQPLNLTKAVVPLTTTPEIQQAKTLSTASTSSSAPITTTANHANSISSASPAVNRVSSLTTLITNSLRKNSNITNVDEIVENIKKRCYESSNVANHPQNPERSIIKGLLLDWQNVTTSSSGTSGDQADESVHACPVCKITFRNADNLKYHTKCYCQGGNSTSAPISPVGSPSSKSARSNSVHVSLPEKYNPNTLVNLARYKLRIPSSHKTPSSLAKLAQSKIKPSKPKNINISSLITDSQLRNEETNVQLIQAPLPSPGPLLGKTRLVDTYNSNSVPSSSSRKKSDEIFPVNFEEKLDNEKRYFQIPTTHTISSSAYIQQRAPNMKIIPEPLILNRIDQNMLGPKRHLSQHYPILEMFGGEVHIIPKKISDERKSEDDAVRRDLSGGSIISESPGSDSEQNQLSTRTPGLFSGGKVEKMVTSRNSPPITPLTPSLLVTPSQCTPSFVTSSKSGITHFQFPPINSITAYNPLTLPPITTPNVIGHPTPMKMFAGRLIPDIPGIPGPDSMPMKILQMSGQSLAVPMSPRNNRSPSPMRGRSSHSGGVTGKRSSSVSPINVNQNTLMAPPPPTLNGISKSFKLENNDDKLLRSPKERKLSSKSPHNIWSPLHLQLETNRKSSFNFSRITDNISPRKGDEIPSIASSNKYDSPMIGGGEFKVSHHRLLHVDVGPVGGNNNLTLMEKSESPNKSSMTMTTSSKFLRPTSLPLKPGTFTQKRHHGITPTANTLPLISPETPRPSKTCIQMYINGQAYTYLGLKCSTKPFYCTVNKTQPIYLPHHIRTISMYSQWQTCAESCPHPLGLKPDAVIGLYDSRQRPSNCSTVSISRGAQVKYSQGPIMTPFETSNCGQTAHHFVKRLPSPVPPPVDPVFMEHIDQKLVEQKAKDTVSSSSSQISLPGGYESNEDYEYIKGRGSGRFVCDTCGIRCRKPSMLKKHIRTHTNIRPYTCQYCKFSFKTKGNLTKHMKSKSHAKKCEELGIPNTVSEEDIMKANSQNADGIRFATVPGDSDSEDDSDMDDGSDGSDSEEIKTRLPQEEEAARGLLSLSMTPPMNSNSYSNQMEPQRSSQDRTGEDLSIKSQPRSMHYMAPKITFEFPRPEQYYANPSIDRFSKEPIDTDDSSNMPMDLTKPREMKSSSDSQQIVGKILEPALLLSSLMSITDKIPAFNNNQAEIDENKLLQNYLTEKAMHGTKIKQHQRREEQVSYTETHQQMNGLGHGLIVPRECDTNMTESAAEPSSIVLPKMDCQPSGMETLAEIAASSMKLDIKSSTIPDQPVTTVEGQQSNWNLSAKNVASEYLKMATKSTTAVIKSDREDGESSSDQEVGSSDSNQKRGSSISSGIMARNVVVPPWPGFKPGSEFLNSGSPVRRIPATEDGRSVCDICSKTFQKPSQLKLHINIHYLERKYRCEPCAVSFRTQGHLHKHERSVSHHNKVSMTSTFGVPTTTNPRPFKCSDCRVAFRIHGHLAKHLRSKMHVLRLECLCKIPFGTYAELERAGMSLLEIDTTDCESSMASLKTLARQLHEKDPTKLKMLDENAELSDQQRGGVDNDIYHVKTSGDDESDNDDYGNNNGYTNDESLSGNENSEKLVQDMKNFKKRKFGTILNLNENDDDSLKGSDAISDRRLDDSNHQDGEDLDVVTRPQSPIEKRLKLVQ